MAQLKDSKIDGNLEVSGNITLQTTNNGIQGVHTDTSNAMNILSMGEHGNTIVGYDGYANQNGDSNIYGNDITHYVASAGNLNYRPYYRAGDIINFQTRVAGFVTNGGKNVIFTIPITKPVLGTPIATASSDDGFILRQNGYTHGSDGGIDPPVYVKPTSYSVYSDYNSGFVVTAFFDVSTDVTNNSPIGVYWNGTITLS